MPPERSGSPPTVVASPSSACRPAPRTGERDAVAARLAGPLDYIADEYNALLGKGDGAPSSYTSPVSVGNVWAYFRRSDGSCYKIVANCRPMSEDIISCEICELSHRRTAIKCDRCDHTLGTPPDWSSLRAEIPGLKRQMVKGGAVLLAMIALNMALFGGAGYIVLLAPIGWAMDGALRYRSISQQLRRAPRAPAP